MEGTDVCFAPVLTMAEAPLHPHMAAREIFVNRHGVTQPAPAPRFSRTPSTIRETTTADIASITGEWQAGKEIFSSRHGRAPPGHPRLYLTGTARTWMPWTSPGMTVRGTSEI